MSIIDIVYYASIWILVSSGLTFIIAASFFGRGIEEITEEEYRDLF